LNVSTLDGWWCEGYAENRGWRIGKGEEYSDFAYQDAIESQALYNILENQVIPTFYERKNGGVPEKWLGMMKESMKMAFRHFSSRRMLEEYETKFYVQADRHFADLLENSAEKARQKFAQHERLKSLWSAIRISCPVRLVSGAFRVGQTIPITAHIHLGELSPDEVEIELFYGHVRSVDGLVNSKSRPMSVQDSIGNGEYIYACSITCDAAGRYGFTARATPKGDEWIKHMPDLLTWAE
jgi:starch phosphorylase